MPRAKKAADAPPAEGEEGFESGAVFADGSAPVKQDMWEDGERDGDDDGPPPEAPPDADEEARQATFLANAPEWAVLPPRNSEFANATWIEVERGPNGVDARDVVARVMHFPEFAALNNDFGYEVRWRRASKPTRKSRRGPEPIFVTATPVPPRAIWEAEHQGCESYPRLWIDLHWQHFEDRRTEAPFYVHFEEVEAWLHHALMGLEVNNDRIERMPPDSQVFAKTAERYRGYQRGMLEVKRAMMLIPDDEQD